MGMYGLAAPAALVRPFGLVADRPESRSEVRAVYGGFGVATAAVLGAALTLPDLHDGVVTAVAVMLGGMAAGRVVSRLVDRPVGLYPVWFYCGVEIVAALLLVLAVLPA
ncbi:membrane protein [Pseudonocardia sp. EC080610-09]|nr:membrane protein [Pseudonocardia sp. EC080610-09]ALL84636.1 membrane protein [Pseudonocardia sp. EC080619-01]